MGSKSIPDQFTGIWIPAELYLHKELKGSDRELLGSICSFHKSGSKYTSLTYLSELFGTDKSTLRKRVARLEKMGFLIRDDRNSTTGGSNLIKPTPKCYGFDVDDNLPSPVEKKPEIKEIPKKASNTKASKGGQAKTPAQAKTPDRRAKTPADNKRIESKSVNNSQLDQNFSERVMTELLTDHLPAKEKRYAGLKIREYQERFPDSESVADCWSYVAQAVNHKMNIGVSL